ncbi:MAG: hypothetical protein QHJ82_12210 [Verrucomicrobiota bacterium]|nr:hypothetical protein [Verrucomicrobiota bacterium]
MGAFAFSHVWGRTILRGVVFAAVCDCADEVPIGFDAARYQALLGETIPVRIELKSTLPVGLFSYGLRLVYAPELGGVGGVSAISVPPELDFDGVLGPGARKEAGAGFGAVKGTVDFFASPARFYSGNLLAVFDLTCVRLGEYVLGLEIHRTIGPTETVFVRGDGVPLDDFVRFGTATLTVIPENRTGCLLLGGMIVLAVARLKLGLLSKRQVHV